MAMVTGMKRKGVVDQVSDDFSDFSLSSPATKIRRLDFAELPPIPEMEEDMEQVEIDFPNPNPNPNEERAIVVYNPLSPSPHSPFSFTLHPDLLSGFKNWSSKQHDSDCDRLIRSQQQEQEDDKYNQRMAIVPWAPSSSSSLSHVEVSNNTTTNTEEEEPDDEMGGDMDIEIEQQQQQDQTVPYTSTPTIPPLNLQNAVVGTTPMEFYQWQQQQQQQQHCFLPQFPQNTSTPITWTR